MTAALKILPGTGKGTMRSMVEGLHRLLQFHASPSVSPVGCHLPVPGRTYA